MFNVANAVKRPLKWLAGKAQEVAASKEKKRRHHEQQRLWSQISFPRHQIDHILHLYEKYQDDLRLVREAQKRFYSEGKALGLNPQLGDMEAEITYLRIREFKPETVVEFSPASGWSTSWILHALKDNGAGTLYSYDLVDSASGIIPPALAHGRWVFHKGDVKTNLATLAPPIEYLFIDSDHRGDFARWYIADIFPRLAPHTPVSAHDILKYADEPGWGEESTVLCTWLIEQGKDCFTASRAFEGSGYREVQAVKARLGLDDVIHPPDYNSMIFFT